MNETKTHRKRRSDPVRDHLGREYVDLEEMCQAWGISVMNYQSRKKYGWSLERILTESVNKKRKRSQPVYDHLGNAYGSVLEMCNHWHITRETYYRKTKEGYSLEETLVPSRQCTDHTGRTFHCLDAMLKHWGVSRHAFNMRTAQGMSVEEALTHVEEPVKDHLGSTFRDVLDMLVFYGIQYEDYRRLLDEGKSLEEILLPHGTYKAAEDEKVVCYDHEGRAFPTITDMCRYWEVTLNSYEYRISSGKSLKEALTTELCTRNLKKYDKKDHLGREFGTVAEMCAFWGVPYQTFCIRMRKGMTTEQALTKEPRQIQDRCIVTDHEGTEFRSKEAMLQHWGIPCRIYQQRIAQGWTKEEALTEKWGTACDHLGSHFRGLYKMLDFYKVDRRKFEQDITDGASLADALMPNGKMTYRAPVTPWKRTCADHEKNVYPTKKEMCRHWKVRTCVFYRRTYHGWELEKALTTPERI